MTFTIQGYLIIKPLRLDILHTRETDFAKITRSLASLIEVEFMGSEEYVGNLAIGDLNSGNHAYLIST